MDEYTENRFGYLREKSVEELQVFKEQLISEINYLSFVINDKNASSNLKSEIKNSDLKFEEERLEYVEYLLKEKEVKRKRWIFIR